MYMEILKDKEIIFKSDKKEDLLENLVYFVNSISKIKPSTVKGDYIKNISVSTTMGPGVKVSINSFDK